MEPRGVSEATTTKYLEDCNALPVNSANVKYHQCHTIKSITQKAYPVGAVAHPEPPPRTKLAPWVQESWPPPEMKNWIWLGTPEYLTDLAELLAKVKHSPEGTLVAGPWAPVQSAPAKKVMVADIATDAEATRAVVMKTILNCIVMRSDSF